MTRAIVCLLGAAVALALIVSAADLLVGNDTPRHLFAAFANNHLHERAFGFARVWQANTPVTSHGYVELVRLLEPLLGWRGAHRVALIALAELSALAFAALVLSRSRERWPVALLGLPLALPWLLYVGAYPMVAACAFAVLALACGANNCTERPLLRTGALALALLAAALCHPLPAALAIGALVVLALPRALRPAQELRALALLLAAAAPALVIVVLARAAFTAPPALPDEALLTFGQRAFSLVVTGSPARGVAHAALVVVALAIGLWGAAPTVGEGGRRCRAFGGRPDASTRPSALVGALLVLVPLAAATFVGTRASAACLSLGTALLLSLLPWERASPLMRRALAALLVAWLAASAVSVVALHRAMARATEGPLALLDAGPVTARWAPAKLRQPLLLAGVDGAGDMAGVPAWRPLLHVGALYAIAGVGAVPASAHASEQLVPALDHLLRRADSEADPPGIDPWRMPGLANPAGDDADDGAMHARKVVQLSSSARGIGRAFAFGRDGDVEELVRRGWRIEARRARAALLTFQGCDVTLAVTATGPRTVSIAPRVQTGTVEPEVTVSVEGPGDVAVRGVSCGPAVVVSTPPCAGSDGNGRRDAPIVNGGRVLCAR